MIRRAGTLLVLALLAAACPKIPPPLPPPPPPPPPAAKPRDDLYVVLPAADGRVGAITVTTPDGRHEVLDRPHAAVRIPEAGRLETGTATPEEVRTAFGAALAAQPGRPASFTLYFVEGRDQLTPESEQTLQAMLAEMARRPAPEITVIGHTDRVGTVAYNDTLSLQRATRVRDELVRRGIPPDRITSAGRGEREPLVPTADEVAEPRNRRVEISVR